MLVNIIFLLICLLFPALVHHDLRVAAAVAVLAHQEVFLVGGEAVAAAAADVLAQLVAQVDPAVVPEFDLLAAGQGIFRLM